MSRSQVAAQASFEALGGPLESIDLLGRQKMVAVGSRKRGSAKTPSVSSAFATIKRNAFKYKSLSSWSYNIAVGCRHGCRFCYVPDSQQTGPGRDEEHKNMGALAKTLREFGVLDPDADWGKYVLRRHEGLTDHSKYVE